MIGRICRGGELSGEISLSPITVAVDVAEDWTMASFMGNGQNPPGHNPHGHNPPGQNPPWTESPLLTLSTSGEDFVRGDFVLRYNIFGEIPSEGDFVQGDYVLDSSFINTHVVNSTMLDIRWCFVYYHVCIHSILYYLVYKGGGGGLLPIKLVNAILPRSSRVPTADCFIRFENTYFAFSRWHTDIFLF